jgi:PhnB protein
MLGVNAMKTQISPMLAVSDGNAAMAFYEAAFGATILWHLDHAVAGLSIDGAQFFLAHESPPHGTRSPAAVNFTTVRIELFVDDPVAVHRRALAAGAVEHSPVQEHTHTTRGPHPIRRMLQGAVVDPFGHLWLVGKILE